MEIGVIGKPNVGKSTLFNAFTLLDVPMAPYPFTTLEPHHGTGAIRVPCPHHEKGTACTPGNAKCVDGTRWVPVNLVDVPGLVPGASEGKGLGRKFLDDLRASDGFIQVVDAAGATTAEGVSAEPGTVDPSEEVTWLEDELVDWVAGILGRDFERNARSVELEGRRWRSSSTIASRGCRSPRRRSPRACGGVPSTGTIPRRGPPPTGGTWPSRSSGPPSHGSSRPTRRTGPARRPCTPWGRRSPRSRSDPPAPRRSSPSAAPPGRAWSSTSPGTPPSPRAIRAG